MVATSQPPGPRARPVRPELARLGRPPSAPALRGHGRSWPAAEVVRPALREPAAERAAQVLPGCHPPPLAAEHPALPRAAEARRAELPAALEPLPLVAAARIAKPAVMAG